MLSESKLETSYFYFYFVLGSVELNYWLRLLQLYLYFSALSGSFEYVLEFGEFAKLNSFFYFLNFIIASSLWSWLLKLSILRSNCYNWLTNVVCTCKNICSVKLSNIVVWCGSQSNYNIWHCFCIFLNSFLSVVNYLFARIISNGL